MGSGEVHKNDVGTTFILTIKDQDEAVVDVSSASTKQVLFQGPNNKKVAQTASFTTDGTDGKIEYSLQSGDIPMVGTWKVQGKVVVGGSTWFTDITEFTVYDNLT